MVGCDLLLRNRSAGVEDLLAYAWGQKRRLGVPAYLAGVMPTHAWRKSGTDYLTLAGRSRGFIGRFRCNRILRSSQLLRTLLPPYLMLDEPKVASF